MQATSDITTKNTEYLVNLMYPFLYSPERNDEARTADWCAALSDATSSVEGTDPQSEQSDQSQLPNQELIYDQYDLSFLSTIPLSLPLQALTRDVQKRLFRPHHCQTRGTWTPFVLHSLHPRPSNRLPDPPRTKFPHLLPNAINVRIRSTPTYVPQRLPIPSSSLF